MYPFSFVELEHALAELAKLSILMPVAEQTGELP